MAASISRRILGMTCTSGVLGLAMTLSRLVLPSSYRLAMTSIYQWYRHNDAFAGSSLPMRKMARLAFYGLTMLLAKSDSYIRLCYLLPCLGIVIGGFSTKLCKLKCKYFAEIAQKPLTLSYNVV